MDKKKNSLWMLSFEDGEVKLNPFLEYVKKKKNEKQKKANKKALFDF